MYSNAVAIVRSFCISNGHPISTSPNLQWHEIEAYASIAKAQYAAQPNMVKDSLATQFTYPNYIFHQSQPNVVVNVHSPIPAALVAQIEEYQADPLPGS